MKPGVFAGPKHSNIHSSCHAPFSAGPFTHPDMRKRKTANLLEKSMLHRNQNIVFLAYISKLSYSCQWEN